MLPALQKLGLVNRGRDRHENEIFWVRQAGEPLVGASTARGWIVNLEARDDGLWGQVEWTAHGSALMADKAYLQGVLKENAEIANRMALRTLRKVQRKVGFAERLK